MTTTLNPRKSKCKIALPPGAPMHQGCSGLAATAGMSKHTTQWTAYHRFIGDAPAPTEEQQEIFDRGHRAEDFIAKEIENTYGYRMTRSNYAWVHPDYDWWICHPDRLMVGKVDGKRIGIEIKSSSVYTSKEWGPADTDEVPIDYYMQCLGYMACGVCDEVHLFRCSDWRLTRYVIGYDEQKIRQLEGLVVPVVESFLRREEPLPTTYDECKQCFEVREGDLVADERLEALCEEYDKAKEAEAEAKKHADNVKVAIMNRMSGKATRILPQGGGTKPLHSLLVYEQTKLDTKRLKEEQPEIYGQYTKTTTVQTFK